MADGPHEANWTRPGDALESPPAELSSHHDDIDTPESLKVVAATPDRDLFSGIKDATSMSRTGAGVAASASVYDTTSYNPDRYVPAAGYQPTSIIPAVLPAISPYDRPVTPSRRAVWPWVAGVAVLLLGLLAGALIMLAVAGDDPASDSEAVVATTQLSPPTTLVLVPVTVSPAQIDAAVNRALDGVLADASDGSLPETSGYAQLDDVVALHTAAAVGAMQPELDALVLSSSEKQAAFDTLTVELGIADTETAAAIAERDVLAANLSLMSGSSSGLQTAVTERDATIVAVRAELATANAAVVAANVEVARLRGELATAAAAYAKLNPKQTGTWVGAEVGKARAAAATNSWTIIEVPTESATTPVGQIIRQQPSPSSTMVNGSVLYVEVAVAAR